MRMSERRIEDIYPLSPMQQGMLFHSLAAPEAGMYVDQSVWSLRDVNTSAFKRAWQYVVDRHQVLRTSFVWGDLDEPLQVVWQHIGLAWDEYDWRGLSEIRQRELSKEYLKADRRHAFELTTAPLMRFVLARIGPEAYEFIWTRHHILLDGWSLPLLLSEVIAVYNGFCEGREIRPKPSRRYRDYIEWLQRQDLTKAEAFWRKILKGFTTPTRLATPWVVGKLNDGDKDYDEREIRLAPISTDGLHAFARRNQLTLNTVVQGAWALLLARYGGAEDVVFGAIVSGRSAELVGIEDMVGLFINTLPVRVRATRDASLLPWLQEIQAQQAEVREYEYCPLLRIQGWSEVPRNQPLFETALGFDNYPVDQIGQVPSSESLRRQRSSLDIRHDHSATKANFPLSVVVRPGPELWIKILYDCKRFDARTITGMLGHFQTLLEGIRDASPETRPLDLSLLTETERKQLLATWSGFQPKNKADACIHWLFEARVEKDPDRIAVVFGGAHLTYRELNVRANQVAYHLRSLGIRPEHSVGICMQRSLEMIVAVLGVLKAGSAYVPLDPSYPKERLVFMLEDTQARVVLAQQQTIHQLPRQGAQIVRVDAPGEDLSEASKKNPTGRVTAKNLAYIIYTSGSTGKPKGVMVEHGGLCKVIQAQIRAFDIGPESRVLQFASLSFDASVSEIFMTLLAGATLCLGEQDDLYPGSALSDFLSKQLITAVTLPPSVLAALPVREYPELRTLIVAGEVCPPELAARWVKGRRFFNAYGPTEATICATIGEFTSGDQRLTIGSVSYTHLTLPTICSV